MVARVSNNDTKSNASQKRSRRESEAAEAPYDERNADSAHATAGLGFQPPRKKARLVGSLPGEVIMELERRLLPASILLEVDRRVQADCKPDNAKGTHTDADNRTESTRSNTTDATWEMVPDEPKLD